MPRASIEQLIDRARDPAFILDPSADRFVAANPAGCELLGQIVGGGSAVAALAAQLHEACGGTPALCVDLLISACREGALVRRAGRWQV